MRFTTFTSLVVAATSASGVVGNGSPTFSLSTSLKQVHLNPIHHLSAVFFPAKKKGPHHPKRATTPPPSSSSSSTTSTTTANTHHVPYCRLRPLSLTHQPGEDDDSPPSSAGPSATKTRTRTAATPSSTSSTSPSQPTQSGSGSGTTGPETGVINVKSTCGDIGATAQVTLNSGPNGSQDWLDCGLETDKGWQPQMVTLDDLVFHRDLETAMKQEGSPYTACTDLLDIMNKYAKQFNIPPVLIAAIALQESSCNPNTMGGGGEAGIMQISPEKCDGAPNGNCLDPDFNIMKGAQYLRTQLDSNGGNILKTLGNYNGWYVGMTIADAKKAASGPCCRCQQNLDYIHALFNGWLQNKNAYNPRMGKYFNLDVCNGK